MTFVNRMQRYEALSEEALDVIDGGWRRLARDVGVEFLHPRALALFAAAGQLVEGERVRFDPDFLVEQAAKAPRASRCTRETPSGASCSAASTWCSSRSRGRRT